MKVKTGRQIAADTKSLLAKVERDVAPAKAKERAEISGLAARLELAAKADVEKHKAKSKTRASRTVALRLAESEVAATAPKDPRLTYSDMAPAKARAKLSARKAKAKAAPNLMNRAGLRTR